MAIKKKEKLSEEPLSFKDVFAFTLAAFQLLLPYILLVILILGGILLLAKILV